MSCYEVVQIWQLGPITPAVIYLQDKKSRRELLFPDKIAYIFETSKPPALFLLFLSCCTSGLCSLAQNIVGSGVDGIFPLLLCFPCALLNVICLAQQPQLGLKKGFCYLSSPLERFSKREIKKNRYWIAPCIEPRPIHGLKAFLKTTFDNECSQAGSGGLIRPFCKLDYFKYWTPFEVDTHL